LHADSHSFTELTEDAPIVTLWHCLLFQIFGWPLYMLDFGEAVGIGVLAKGGFDEVSVSLCH
jgi:hypothetical protein